jgi:hypothetical protein
VSLSIARIQTTDPLDGKQTVTAPTGPVSLCSEVKLQGLHSGTKIAKFHFIVGEIAELL